VANMSYCRFENTSGDLYDCVESLRDLYEGYVRVKHLSETEFRGFNALERLCREYLEMYEHIADHDLITTDYNDPRLKSDNDDEDDY